VADRLDRDRSIEHLLRQTLQASTAVTSCLDAEQLAAWVAGGLTQSEAAAAEQHLADCSHCQSMLAAFVESEPAPVVVASPVVRPLRWRSRATWLVPAAAAAAVALVWVAVTREPTDLPPSVTTMARVEDPSPAQPAEVTGSPEVSRGAVTAVDPPVPVDPQLQPGRGLAQSTSPSPAINQQRQESAADRSLTSSAVPRSFAIGAVPLPSIVDSGAAGSASPAAPPIPTQTSPASNSAPAPSPPAGPAERSAGRAAVSPRFDSSAAAVRSEVAPISQPTMGTAVRADLPVHVQALGRGAVEFSAPTVGTTTLEAARSAQPVRWRIEATGSVARSADGGVSWAAVLLAPSTVITAGSAPVGGVCWLAGRNGTVLRSTDDATFVPVVVPEAGAVATIQARDASTATVTMAGGRVFSTTDGGRSWRVLP